MDEFICDDRKLGEAEKTCWDLAKKAAWKAIEVERLRRFDVEARAVSSMQHANIVALYDVGEFEQRPFLVSELLQGETLRERLSRSPLAIADAIDLALQLCRGLSAAHDKGFVHRDIKPELVHHARRRSQDPRFWHRQKGRRQRKNGA